MSRFSAAFTIAVLAAAIPAEAFAQRLGGACRGIERRGYVGLPKLYQLRVWSANRPSVWYRRGIQVFRTSASPYYFGGRTTWNKSLRGNYYCGRFRFNTVGITRRGYRAVRPVRRPAIRSRRVPSVFTSTPVFSSRITYGDKYGWNQLAKGKPAEAMKVFLQQARRQPNYGMPKVGYAIALAANGDLAEGAKILRFAIKKHPRTVERMSLDAKARQALQALAANYRTADDDKDAALLLATIDRLQPKAVATKQTAAAGELRIIPR